MWLTGIFKPPAQRERLLKLLNRIRKQLADAEKMSAEATDDATLRKASYRLAESRELLATVEKLLQEATP